MTKETQSQGTECPDSQEPDSSLGGGFLLPSPRRNCFSGVVFVPGSMGLVSRGPGCLPRALPAILGGCDPPVGFPKDTELIAEPRIAVSLRIRLLRLSPPGGLQWPIPLGLGRGLPHWEGF